ncbi:MAG: alpha/beta fold hydrolase [Clostridia bacterium]|nr:alpha/beta fold hydrolase [Clostridia bacterium]
MNYIHKDITFPSSDGKNTIHAELFIPSDNNIRGVVQIAHGMMDYIGRYALMAEALCAAGYALAGNDHLGHGDSVSTRDDYGFFASKNGYSYVIDDVKGMNDLIRHEIPDVPVVLLGHSMGSFIARLYAHKYPESINGLIIHGTAGPNPATGAGKLLVKLLRAVKGERHRSKFVCSLADGGYNKGFDPAEGSGAWLTRDPAMVADRVGNPKNDFIFTLAGYEDLFTMLGRCNSKAWFKGFPKELPTLVISGDQDPVGGFKKGVQYVYDNLHKYGANVELKFFEGARHELFNEINRDEVFSYIIAWLEDDNK